MIPSKMTIEELKAAKESGQMSDKEYELRLVESLSGECHDRLGPEPSERECEKGLENWAKAI